MSESRTLARNVTVEGTTYPAGTKVSDLDKDVRDAIVNPKAFDAADEVTASVGAGAYDDTKVWTKAALQDEIDKRNDDLPEESQINPEGSNRGDLIQALEQNDANTRA